MTHTILITGVTSGLGAALARQIAGRGDRVIGVGRRPLSELDGSLFDHTNYIQADLVDPEAADQIASWCETQGVSRIDLLIHNAALGWYGNFADQSAPSIATLVQVNLKAPLAVTQRLLPLLPSPHGKIVFVSSVASVLPAADYAVYTATKAALDGLARSLRVEFDGRLQVQVIHPGAINSGMHAKIGIPPSRMKWDNFPSPEKTAAHVMHAIGRGRANIAIGLPNKLLRTVGRLAPRILRRATRPSNSSSGPQPTPWRALVTGAADGIGRALAEQLTNAGHDVVGVDIDKKKGVEVADALKAASGHFAFTPLDLTDPAALEQFVIGIDPPFDLVIHNAGTSAVGHFECLAVSSMNKVIDLNFVAPLQLTALLTGRAKINDGANFYFVSSLSKYTGYPGAAAYAATKDGVASYAASLHAAAQRGMRTGVVYPGPTRTAHARRFSPDNSREGTRMSPETVAAAIIKGAAKQRAVIIPGPTAKISALLGTLFPRLMEKVMRRVIYDKLEKA